MEEETARRREAQIRLMIAAASLGYMAWAMLPAHRKALVVMRACDLIRRRALRAAAWTGAQGIRVEAGTGDEASAAVWYGSALWLATMVAERAREGYERARAIT